jgi:CBS domain-containing protein
MVHMSFVAHWRIGNSEMHPSDPVNRFMTAAVMTVDVNDPAGEVLRLFAGYPVHHLPVLDQQKVIGMLSSADVMKLEMFVPKGGKSPIDYLNQRMKVRPLLRGPALTIPPHQSVETAAQLMAKHGIHALAVVNSQDNLLGIITTTDIMHAVLGGHEPVEIHGLPAGPGVEPQRIRLSAQELDQAMAAARASTAGEAELVYRALAYLHARVGLLEQMRRIASRYLQAGQDQQLHAALCKALDAVGLAEERGYMEVVER